MRKLCTDKVRGVKMKKTGKKHVLQFKRRIFFPAVFGCSFGFAFQR
jgi:hypothetical protein